MKIFRSIWLSAVLAALVAGCSTVPEPPDASRPEVVRQELRELLDGELPQRAIPRITALRTKGVLADSELELLFSEAVERLQTRFAGAMEQPDYDRALTLYYSLVALGVELPADGPVDVTESSLLAAKASQFLEEGNRTAALSVLLQVRDMQSLPVALLELGLAAAVELNNRSAAQELVQTLEALGTESSDQTESFLSRRHEPEQMLDGVVTVLVNRGLRLEGGVGIPDRMIGSGFFIDPRGYIITNYHVIESEVDPEYEGYSRLFVRLRDDPVTRIPARVVGYSRVFDVALLKIERDAPLVFGFSDIRELRPGASIIAIGSPGGLENSITSGVISATGRRFLQMGDTMQIDVPVNPGNSGGPLFDDSGRLVGIVFAGIEQFEGVNFAIPGFWVHRFLPSLFESGSVAHPWAGVAVEQHEDGLEVVYASLGSPAASAGLVAGDVISSINGEAVATVPQAHDVLLQRAPGALIRLGLAGNENRDTAFLVLEERPRRPVVDALESDLQERLFPVLYGMQVERAGQDFFRQAYTVARVYPGTVADEIGISEGDRFTQLGFDFVSETQVVLLRIFIQKRTDGFMRTNIQLPAFTERDNFL